MRVSIVCVVVASFVLASSSGVADDKGPQPTTTTSGSKAGILIQNIGFPDDSGGGKRIVILKKDDERYAAARKDLNTAIAQFDQVALAASKGKSVSKAQMAAMQDSIGLAGKSAEVLNQMAGAAIKSNGSFINIETFKFDGIDGESQSQIMDIARRLKSLDAQLGLIEPVVHR